MKHLSRKAVAAGVTVAAAGLAVTAMTASAAQRAGIQVCGLMPDTKTSVRWEQFDKPYADQGLQGSRRLRPRRQRAG